jgi:hypothetical protein
MTKFDRFVDKGMIITIILLIIVIIIGLVRLIIHPEPHQPMIIAILALVAMIFGGLKLIKLLINELKH